MVRNRTAVICLLIPAAALPFGPAVRGEDPDAGGITRESLHEMLVDELTRIFHEERRFAPLPPVITEICASPEAPPCFAFSRQDTYARDVIDTVAESYRSLPAGFGILAEARFLGRGDGGKVAVATVGRHPDGAIVGEDGWRRIDLPTGLRLDRAFFVKGHWVVQADGGIYTEGNTTPWPGSERVTRNTVVVADTNGLAAVWHDHAQPHVGEPSWRCSIGVGADENWERYDYEGRPFAGVAGVVQRKDGKLLAIGNRITPLSSEWQGTPSEDELLAALSAARRSDLAEFHQYVERLSLYPREALIGLATLLAELPDRTPPAQEFASALQRSLEAIESMEHRMGAPGEEGVAVELKPVLQQHKADVLRALDAYRKIVGDPAGLSPATVGRMWTGGYQWYDGRWIRGAMPVFQEKLSEAIVELDVCDPAADRGRRGLFRIDAEGHLHLLQFLDPAPSHGRGASIQAVKGNQDDILLLVVEKGLARLGNGRFSWLDQSDTIRTMEKLIGCDERGRVFFERAQVHAGRTMKQKWVMHPGGQDRERVKPVSYPTTGAVAVAEDGRLWFVSGVPGSGSPSPSTLPEPALAKSLPTTHQAPHGMPLTMDDYAAMISSAGVRNRHALYCLAPDGELHCLFSDPVLSGCTLLAGRNGSVLAVSDTGAVLLTDDAAAYRAADAHELARQHFDLLLQCAPLTTRLVPGIEPLYYKPSVGWLAVGDVLWISAKNQVEAYRAGKSLAINDRATLLQPRKNMPILIGPLGGAAEPRVVIACEPRNLGSSVWAEQGKDGIALSKAAMPNAKTPTGSLGDPSDVPSLPLVDYERGRLFYHHGFDRVWQVSGPAQYELLTQAGRPVALTPGGQIVVHRYDRVYPGYRLVGDGTIRDIPVTYKRAWVPVSVEEDGAILCLTSEGVAWLRPDGEGAYTATQELVVTMPFQPERYLGRSADAIFVLARGGQIVAIPAKPQPRQASGEVE